MTTGPVVPASAANLSSAQSASTGTVEMTVAGESASTVTVDVSGGARPVQLQDGSVGVSDGATTSDALPTSINVGNGRTVSGTWSIDDADTVTFHFAADERARPVPA
ncbi:hypothetical protein C5E02_05710 [Rathayibacter rathayi]|uniref:Bacterial Ig domain-containing protein n=1 Tax=Rathayibacter rathayi TaxID=33887 RepID=A0ABD6W600_RATRA|nr:hypothetical protein [Rathayibacter rathayi]AZZ48788.1 hypothetical protein C1O28_05940 [Rathayibacter rathayi]MWV73876.1 hypothetical protein [Rathayibacter rathayi NCPPB 2980 = VKM Ac-1601]PPF11330.1 hypothetical protein C5C04_12325 [Rathayibacter rathayi]PPF50768.1 hypothetical protein C5C08_03890 [Rathayibacter rathayi]PPF77888.1 hypothetical protein C5C14_11875 [Rathayibacter rathayi]